MVEFCVPPECNMLLRNFIKGPTTLTIFVFGAAALTNRHANADSAISGATASNRHCSVFRFRNTRVLKTQFRKTVGISHAEPFSIASGMTGPAAPIRQFDLGHILPCTGHYSDAVGHFLIAAAEWQLKSHHNRLDRTQSSDRAV